MKHALLCGLILLFAGFAFAQAPEPAEPAPAPGILTTLTDVPALSDVNSGWSAAGQERTVEMSAQVTGDQKTWLLSLQILLMATRYAKQDSPYDAHILMFHGQEVGMVLVDQQAKQIRLAIKANGTWYLAKNLATEKDSASSLSLENAKIDGDTVVVQLVLETVGGLKAVDLKFPLK